MKDCNPGVAVAHLDWGVIETENLRTWVVKIPPLSEGHESLDALNAVAV